MRLWVKLQLVILAVVVVGVVVVSLVANQAAEREVRAFMFGNGMTTASGLAQELAEYYQSQASWDGVQALLARNGGHGQMSDMGMNQRLTLVDAENRLIADSAGGAAATAVSVSDAATVVPVQVDGQTVATLLVEGGMPVDDPGNAVDTNALLNRVNRAIWLAALLAGAVGLALGGALAYGLTRPLNQLTAATRGIARGDFAQRVPASSNDEIGELARSLNRMAAALQDAERQRRSLTADIAHELRNPLAVLQGNLEALSDSILPPSPDNLQPLLAQTQLLARIVEDLRTISLAEAGQLALERAPTAPGRLSESVLARYAQVAQERQITLAVLAADDLPSITIDAQRIEQVLGNLISNALRHTPAGGCVVCRVERTAEPSTAVTFSVEDTGPGIPQDALPHIFDRFYRVDRGRARADGGSGLGLSIARQLVEAHHGAIYANNRPQGGATFSFWLPV
ncbi:MAG: HAMP domain-containing protein [Anaerolineales bacterium]|nr:HAMP domain-containing protein [Anaerolineales bacterium]